MGDGRLKEFYKSDRPVSFKDVVGNEAAVAQCKEWVKQEAVPHCILFQGGSGMGKTTLARILANKLDCGRADFQEINAAGQARGIEKIKQIESQLQMAPIQGSSRIYLIDEAQQLTSAAQNALLKMTEDTPSHVYFFFCTTDPQKIVNTLKTRASVVTVSPLAAGDMLGLLKKTCDKHNVKATKEVLERIVDVADGSSRKALVLLYQIAGLKKEEQQLEAISKSDSKAQAIELCRKLINPRVKWPEIADLLLRIEEEPETIRWMMLGYATSVLLKGGKLANACFVILEEFSDNYFDSKKAGLVRDCWTVVHSR